MSYHELKLPTGAHNLFSRVPQPLHNEPQRATMSHHEPKLPTGAHNFFSRVPPTFRQEATMSNNEPNYSHLHITFSLGSPNFSTTRVPQPRYNNPQYATVMQKYPQMHIAFSLGSPNFFTMSHDDPQWATTSQNHPHVHITLTLRS